MRVLRRTSIYLELLAAAARAAEASRTAVVQHVDIYGDRLAWCGRAGRAGQGSAAAARRTPAARYSHTENENRREGRTDGQWSTQPRAGNHSSWRHNGTALANPTRARLYLLSAWQPPVRCANRRPL